MTDPLPWALTDDWAGFELHRFATREAAEFRISITPDHHLIDPDRSKLAVHFDPRSITECGSSHPDVK